jgi:hypothetical protein
MVDQETDVESQVKIAADNIMFCLVDGRLN